MSMPLTEDGNLNYCLDCITKMSIQCAWCEKPIWIGDPVTLYIPENNYTIPKYAVRYDKEPQRLVGCLRQDCGSGVDRKGFWIPPGKVLRVPSPIEMLLSDSGIRNGENVAVIVYDISDPNNLGKII
jgi:hypothetical protein